MKLLLNTFRYVEPDKSKIITLLSVDRIGYDFTNNTYLMKLVNKQLVYENLDIFEYILQFFDENYINKQNDQGWTALMFAIRNSNKDKSCKIVKLLLDAGADVTKVNIKGFTPLMIASLYSGSDSSEDTVKILLEYGADVHYENDKGWTALIVCSRYTRYQSTEDTIKILLEAGADINHQRDDGWTPLIIASRQSNKDSTENTVKILLDAGANINIKTKTGINALMVSSSFSGTDSTENTVRMLLDAGSSVSEEYKDETILGYILREMYIKASKSTQKTVEMLIEAGSDVNKINSKIPKKYLQKILDYGFSLCHPNIREIFGDEYITQILPKIIYKIQMNGRIAGELIYKKDDIKFKPGSIGSKIVIASHMYDKMINKEWYNSLETDGIKDYLSIVDIDDAIDKINQYLNYNSNS